MFEQTETTELTGVTETPKKKRNMWPKTETKVLAKIQEIIGSNLTDSTKIELVRTLLGEK